MEPKLTFKLEGTKLEIHPALTDIFLLLMRIDQENKYLLDHFDNMVCLKKSIIHLIQDHAILMKQIELSGGRINYELTPNELQAIQDIISNIKYPASSIMISLFAYMETFFTLITVYKAGKELNDKQLMIESKNNLRPFVKKYILNEKNEYYANHKNYFKNLTTEKFIDLRNYLTHFYSVPDDVIVLQVRDETFIRKLKTTHENSIFIIPCEIYELLQAMGHIIINERNYDATTNHEDFKNNMNNVIKIVGKKAAKQMTGKRNK